MREIWGARADAAEAAVVTRHLRAVWGLPGTRLGVVGWPATAPERLFLRWHYWWQAHLLDACVDAFHRSPSQARRTRVVRLVRGQHVRNLGRWTNDFNDDMAWLGLALQRADTLVGVRRPAGLDALTGTLLDAWSDERGGIPWRRGDELRNAPANGPAAVLLARTGHLDRAVATADWIEDTLRDPETGLVFDGVRGDELVRVHYSYCQGVALGAEVELAQRTGEPRHAGRVVRLVEAVDARLADDGVLRGHGGGDGGLFTGILARYLAQVALRLPGADDDAVRTRATATRLVLASARAAWAHRAEHGSGPVFGADWSQPAVVPAGPRGAGRSADGAVGASAVPGRDLSVQLAAWLLLEAAAAVFEVRDAPA